MPITNKIVELDIHEKDNKKENKKAEIISMEEKIVERELQRVKEKCESLIEFVSGHYNETKMLEKQKESFDGHNNQILELVIKKGVEKKLEEGELDLLAIAAILHDLCKGDPSPKWAEKIDNFMMIYHGKAASIKIGSQEIINEKNEIDKDQNNKRLELREMLKKILGEDNFKNKMKQLQAAFEAHMGPGEPVTNQEFYEGKLPFMAKSLKEANEQLPENMQVKHPAPEKDDIISNIMRAADMYSLSSPVGVRKMLVTRFFVKDYKDEDEFLCAEYARLADKYNEDILITIGEAALISALITTIADRDMLPEEELRSWVQEAINKTMEGSFDYGPDEKNLIEKGLNPGDVWKKMKTYKRLVRKEKEDNVSEEGEQESLKKIDKAA